MQEEKMSDRRYGVLDRVNEEGKFYLATKGKK